MGMCVAVIFVKLLMHGECVGANVKTQSDKREMKRCLVGGANMCVRTCERLAFWTVLLAVVLFCSPLNLEMSWWSEWQFLETSIWLREMSSASHADILHKNEWRAQYDACWEMDRQGWLKNEMGWWVDRRIMIQSERRVRQVFLLQQTKPTRCTGETVKEKTCSKIFFSQCGSVYVFP